MVDYIIVGFGLAGTHLAHELQRHQTDFVVIDPLKENASKVAGGVNSPLILRRYTTAWRAEQFIPAATNTYGEFEERLKTKLLHPIPIFRKINSIKEQNDWFVASDKPGFEKFMAPNLKNLPQLKSDFGFGEIFKANIVDTTKLIDCYAKHLLNQNSFLEEYFEYDKVEFEKDHIIYKDIRAKKIIFCEGAGVSKNPFFDNLPVNGNKGEYIIIKAPELKIDFILKSNFTLIPLGNDYYKYGATYDREFKNNEPEEKNRKLLLEKLDQLIDCPYELVNVEAGIRPTVPDHKPIIGHHPNDSKLLLCNGLGSHGVMRASTMAKQLIDNEFNNQPIWPEIDILRYLKNSISQKEI